MCAFGFVASAHAQRAGLQHPAADIYDVVALRVEFQPDTTRYTTGDGTFDGVLFPDGLQPAIDPLPHDAAYFEAHLAFLADYVARVSDGQTQVRTHLIPEVVRVSQTMGAYSPTGFDASGDAEQAKLAALVAEAWQRASERSSVDLSGLDPAHTAFVLFHAGVGRDIELLGTTLDKTPQDLPSIYFSESKLVRLGAGDVTFQGLPVRHMIILPRTETRPGFNFIEDRSFLLELSINGLLAASFFNYLGVPDLFNTDTGDPAIGPFGLMDPLGIFTYAGLFPPEPSAWTRYYLGWTDVEVLQGDGPETVTLRAVGADGGVARAEISDAEYFLVENRSRDPEGDGLIMRVWKDGDIVEQTVRNGDESFTQFDVSGFVGGVVVGVDDYDWALPGGVDEDGNELNGGLLIWHVDERRLAAGLATGGVNTDPAHRAIDLEEADSAQDLGFPSSNPFGPAADQGTPFDFYFKDNPITTITATGQEIRFYENRFGPNTIPNSNTNEGGPSFITLEDFSEPGAEMTFVYRREASEGITPLFSYDPFPATDTPVFTADGFVSRLAGTDPEVVFYTGDDGAGGMVAVVNETTGAVTRRIGGDGAVRSVVTPDQRLFYVTHPSDATVRLYARTDEGADEVADFQDAGYTVTQLGEPLMTLANGTQQAFFIQADVAEAVAGIVLELREDGTTQVLTLPDQPVVSLASDGTQPVLVGRSTAQVAGGDVQWAYALDADAEVGQAVFGRDRSGLVGVVPAVNAAVLLFLRADGSVERIDVGPYVSSPGAEAAVLGAAPILLDLDDDGMLDVLATYGRRMLAFSQNGALVRGFPIGLEAAVVAQPLAAERGDNGNRVLFVAATDGYLYAYDVDAGGTLLRGFPLAGGAYLGATPLLQNKITTVSREQNVKGWIVDNLGPAWWGERYGDAQHRSYVALPEAPPPTSASGLIVDAETYNWPNPIRDGQTYLRCMTSEDAAVRITIIDVAGSLIDEVELDLRGGTPAEHLWQTDAQSGLYYARVRATGKSGQTATKLIKMAIIR